MNAILPLSKIRDFGEKVTDTVKFIKLNWKNLVVLYGVFVLPFLLVAVLLGAGYFLEVFTRISAGRASDVFGNWKIWLAMVAILMAVNAMSTSIYLYMKIWEEEDRRATPGDIIQRMTRPFITNLVYTLAVVIVFGLAMALIFFLAVGSKGVSTMILVGLMIFALLIVMVVSMAYVVLIYPTNTIGGHELGMAFQGAWYLLRGHWWASLGYILVIGIIYYIFSVIVQTALTIIFGAGALMGAENFAEGMGKGMAVMYGLIMLVQQLFYIIVFVGAGVLYYSLHEEKIGGGLEKMIDQMGSKTARYGREEEY